MIITQRFMIGGFIMNKFTIVKQYLQNVEVIVEAETVEEAISKADDATSYSIDGGYWDQFPASIDKHEVSSDGEDTLISYKQDDFTKHWKEYEVFPDDEDHTANNFYNFAEHVDTRPGGSKSRSIRCTVHEVPYE